MNSNPALGVLLHSIGGLAAASFYIPYKSVRNWAWENFWIVGGVFSWLIAPWFFAAWLVPGTLQILTHSPLRAVIWSTVFGIIWGIGGLTFGLTMRYLGIALGYAIALGLCAACGTLIPPLFQGKLQELLSTRSGQVVLLGVALCLLGIVFGGWAGITKERELSEIQKKESIKEFNFGLGLVIAIICGVTSAAFAFALATGKPIMDLAVAEGARPLWQNLPVFILVMFGGLLTNLIYCAGLMIRNNTLSALTATHVIPGAQLQHASDGPAHLSAVLDLPVVRRVPLLRNYLLCSLAGLTWYFQFFFYGMGTTQMGKYDFSSWTLHMASIIFFSTIWGIALHEWKGTSRKTHALIAVGLLLLVVSVTTVGYGNYIAAH